MTKKTFIALADVVRDMAPLVIDPKLINQDSQLAASLQRAVGYRACWEHMIGVLADFCQSQNPRFNRARWIAYINGECGPNGGPKPAMVRCTQKTFPGCGCGGYHSATN